jgi:SAM-dependent methyltransferase
VTYFVRRSRSVLDDSECYEGHDVAMSEPAGASSTMTAHECTAAVAAWQQVDEGWGRRAVDFATLSEPSNCREYVALHHRLGVDAGARLLDIACGAGLALELAALRGARCAGIDASPRLVAVAADRNPDADVRVGDMNDLPWTEGSFDVVTSCRGIAAEQVREGLPVRALINVTGFVARKPTSR